MKNEIYDKLSFTAKELLDADLSEPELLIPGFIQKGTKNIIAGASGSLKSYICLYIILQCVCDKPISESIHPNKDLKVLILDQENSILDIRKRLKKIIAGSQLEIANINDNIRFICQKPIKFNLTTDQINSLHYIDSIENKNLKLIKMLSKNEEYILEVIRILENYNPDLIIIDSFTRHFSGDQNNPTDINTFYENMKSIGTEDTAWIIIHHTTKQSSRNQKQMKVEDVRGSGDLIASMDYIYLMSCIKEHKKYNLKMGKSRNILNFNKTDINLIDTKDGGLKFEFLNVNENKINLKNFDRINEIILSWIENNNVEKFKTGDIKPYLEDCGFAHNFINEAFKQLVKDEILFQNKQGTWNVGVK